MFRIVRILLPLLLLLTACGVPGVSVSKPGEQGANAPTADIAATVEAQVKATTDAILQGQPTQSGAASSIATEMPATSIPQTPDAPAATEAMPTATPAPSSPTLVPVSNTTPEGSGAMLLVLDSSGSMLLDSGNGQPKIDVAKSAMNSLIDSLPNRASVGLRVYGHRYPNTDKANGCQDSELIAPVAALDKAAMKQAIGSFQAKGYTPISYSLEQGYNDLPAEGARTIVLVSDGEETCDRDPCEVAAQLKTKGVDLIIDTVGFQVDDKARSQLRCIAEKTGGTYYDANNADELTGRLKTISQRALREYQVAGGQIQGGGDYRSAPLISAGEYVDVLRVGENVYYKFQLKNNTLIKWRVTMIPPDEKLTAVASMKLSIYDQDRNELGTETQSLDLLSSAGDPVNGLIGFKPAAGKTTLPDGEYYLVLKLAAVTGAEAMSNYDFTAEMLLEIE